MPLLPVIQEVDDCSPRVLCDVSTLPVAALISAAVARLRSAGLSPSEIELDIVSAYDCLDDCRITEQAIYLSSVPCCSQVLL